MGGLRSRLPRTYLLFTVGVLAIAGIPPLSGFWSKDEILAHTWAWAIGTSCSGPWRCSRPD